MTRDKLAEILTYPIEEQIKALSVSSYDVPKWSDLVKEYDPKQHSIRTNLVKYPLIPDGKGGDAMKRLIRGMQRTLTDRITQSMFVTPVDRKYTFDRENEAQKAAIDAVEQIYRTDNNIDSENIERGKTNNASCQVATIWYTTDEPSIVNGLESTKTLKNKSYSEKDGYKLYPIIDNDKKLIVISFEYKDASDVEYFDIYANLEKPEFIRFIKDGGDWLLSDASQVMEVFPVSYTHLDAPVWGDTTVIVEEIEEILSYRSMYIKKNAVPFATMDMGDTGMMSNADPDKKITEEDRLRLLRLGVGGKVEYPVWDMNNGTVDQHIKDMTNAFYDDNQAANMSFSNLMASNASADNKEIMLTDSKSRAIDLGGEWAKFYNLEVNDIVIPLIMIIHPSLAGELNLISVRSVIKPYVIKSDKERAEEVATAGSSMSLSTQVRILDKVDDIEQEVDAIESERGATTNQL